MLPPLDFHALADAAGVEYRLVEGDIGADIDWALSQGGPSLLAVPVGDSVGIVRTRVARRSKDAVSGLLGARLHCAPGCCDCCRQHISVFPVEAVNIALALDALPGDAADGLRRRAARAPADGPCPLLDADARCALYPVRPIICRTQGLPLLIATATENQMAACPKNEVAGALLPADAVVDLERLNRILAAVNRLFVQSVMPKAPERIPIAAALEIRMP
jgi:hypothetical protein